MKNLIITLIVTVLLIGGLSCDYKVWEKEEEEKPSSTGTVRIYNNTATTVFYFYIRSAGGSSWGSDRLGASVVGAGQYFSILNVPAGTYDFKAASSGGASCAYGISQVLPANMMLTLTVNSWGGCVYGNVVCGMQVDTDMPESESSDNSVSYDSPADANTPKE